MKFLNEIRCHVIHDFIKSMMNYKINRMGKFFVKKTILWISIAILFY